jgi:hypothetical protein
MPPAGSFTPLHVRMSRMFTIDSATGCWIWSGSLSSQGEYPTTTNEFGQIEYAYRAMYRLAFGEIPEGRHVHHRCGNRQCVCPGHLEALTPEQHRARHRAERETRYNAQRPWIAESIRSGLTTVEIKTSVGVPAYFIEQVRRQLRASAPPLPMAA